MESDSWSDALPPETIITKKIRKNTKDAKLILLIKTMKIYKNLQQDIPTKDYRFTHEYNLIRQIEKLPAILQYRIMKKYVICGRLVIFISTKSKPQYFIQSLTLKQIENKSLKGKGVVMGIDTLGNIQDLTYQYSTKAEMYLFFKKILEKIITKNKPREDICWREFDKLDDTLLRKFPTNKEMYKNHPLYVLESLLPKNKIIFSSDFCGTFKGEKVFHRKDVRRVYTELNLKSLGLQPKGALFAKKIDNEKVYLEIQTEKIRKPEIPLNEIKNYWFNYEHEIPLNCVYKSYPSIKLCDLLNIEFKEVSYKNEKGVFINKKDESLYERALEEYKSLQSLNDMSIKSLITMKSLNKLKKYVETYLKIKKRFDE